MGLFILSGQSVSVELVTHKVEPPQILINEIQSGGYIIYFRHGITQRKDKNRNKKLVDLSRCETQRNLTEEGRAQVKRIGKVISALKIPIGKVLSSPYCRTQESAKALFGDYDVDPNLAFSMAKEEAESVRLGKYLYDVMLASDDSVDNPVFVGHTANLKDGLGVWPKPEGVAVIFKKQDGKIIYKGMISPSDWPQ